MKETIIRITAWGWNFKRIDDGYFSLMFYGNTKDGKGNRHKIYIKLRYAWTGYFVKEFRHNLQKQIDRFKTYFED